MLRLTFALQVDLTIATALATLLCLSPCGCGPPGVEAAGAALAPGARAATDSDAVRLVYTDVYDNGCPTCTVARGYIEVLNLAYQKQVTLVYALDSGSYQEFAAWYRGASDAQHEIWWFQLGLQHSLRFALRYDVAGQEYWDNNGGQDYEVTVDAGSGALIQAALGTARDVALTTAQVPGLNNPTELDLTMLVRNRAYQKQVTVVYSSDGWATTQTAAAQFQQGLGGVERWAVRAPLSGESVTGIAFAVAATQAGVTQWDNNGCQDFSCILCESTACQDWVCQSPTLP